MLETAYFTRVIASLVYKISETDVMKLNSVIEES